VTPIWWWESCGQSTN